MNHYIDPDTNELFAYDDEQVSSGIVRQGLVACQDRPTQSAIWQGCGWIEPAMADAQKIAINIDAIQRELDRKAQEKGYDNIMSACSYAAGGSGDPFQAEGAAFLAWRSAAWAQAYAVLDEVKAGTRVMPTPEEAVAMMPTLNSVL